MLNEDDEEEGHGHDVSSDQVIDCRSLFYHQEDHKILKLLCCEMFT